jgi:hypothetical protein
VGIRDVYGQRIGLEVLEDVLQLSRPLERRDHVREEEAEAQAAGAGVDRDVPLIDREPAGERDRGLAGVDAEAPLASRREPRKPDAAVLTDVAGPPRRSVPAQIRGAGAYDRSHRADRYRNERGVGEVADAHGDVHAFLDQAHDAVDEQEVSGDFRVRLDKLVHHRRDVAPAEHHRRSHGQPPLRLEATGSERRLCLAHLAEDDSAVLEVLPALVG